MNVFACTHEGEIVPVQLAPAEIAARGIDAWRLDLFDPDPIVLEVGGQPLRFRKLSDLSFCYQQDERMVVGLHDGKHGQCLHGKPATPHIRNILEDMRACEGCFEKHLRRYLEVRETVLLEAAQKAVLKHKRTGLFTTSKPERRLASEPCSASDVQLRGGRLHFRGERLLRAGTLTGASYDYQPLPVVAVPQPLAWLHRAAAKWNPLVFGESLRKSLLGEGIKHVDFMINEADLPALKKHLEKEFGIEKQKESLSANASLGLLRFTMPTLEKDTFSYEDCEFAVYDRMVVPLQEWLASHCGYSADDMFSTRPGQIHASRIALLDACKRQARALKPVDLDEYIFEMYGGRDWKKFLIDDGYRILCAETDAKAAQDEGEKQ